MKLWLITQSKERGYDTYDSAVVATINEIEAKNTHPGTGRFDDGRSRRSWCNSPNDVTATLLGVALKGTQAGIICASFNAG